MDTNSSPFTSLLTDKISQKVSISNLRRRLSDYFPATNFYFVKFSLVRHQWWKFAVTGEEVMSLIMSSGAWLEIIMSYITISVRTSPLQEVCSLNIHQAAPEPVPGHWSHTWSSLSSSSSLMYLIIALPGQVGLSPGTDGSQHLEAEAGSPDREHLPSLLFYK